VDRQIRRLGLALLLLFLLLIGQVSYVQVFAASRIANDPANATRQLIAEYHVDRGQILTSDGVVMALSRPSKGELVYARHYPNGDLYGGITGYYSLVFGRTGLEASMNPYLSGDAPELAVQTLSDLILGRPKKGGTVITTIDSRLQNIAQQALGNEPGAVVAIDPRTGDLKAMVANPTYDPNQLSSQDPAEIRAARARLLRDPNQPLLNRANQQLYPPGSTFKMITASAAIEAGDTLQTTYPNPSVLDLPLTSQTIHNFGGETCPGGSTTTLLTAFTYSCNVIFGEVGLKLGADRLAAQAHAFGFCPTDPTGTNACLSDTFNFSNPPFGVRSESGRFPEASYFQGRDPAVAISAIGQENDLANPLSMALVASAIANHGVLMQPRLVSEIRDAQGRVIRTFQPQEYGRPISARTSELMTTMMEAVVDHGTGTAANLPCGVAGKTGTAENSTGPAPHAWFVSFAPAKDPQLVVAVIVLNGGSLGSEATGGAVAAPIAAKIFSSYVEGC